MGTAALPLFDRRGVQVVRHLLARVIVRATYHQQFFFGAYMRPHVPDRAPLVWRKSGNRVWLDVGPVSLRHVLVHALGVGNKPVGAADRGDFLAVARHGRSRGLETLG